MLENYYKTMEKMTNRRLGARFLVNARAKIVTEKNANTFFIKHKNRYHCIHNPQACQVKYSLPELVNYLIVDG